MEQCGSSAVPVRFQCSPSAISGQFHLGLGAIEILAINSCIEIQAPVPFQCSFSAVSVRSQCTSSCNWSKISALETPSNSKRSNELIIIEND